jgi:hypothetical protein
MWVEVEKVFPARKLFGQGIDGSQHSVAFRPARRTEPLCLSTLDDCSPCGSHRV